MHERLGPEPKRSSSRSRRHRREYRRRRREAEEYEEGEEVEEEEEEGEEEEEEEEIEEGNTAQRPIMTASAYDLFTLRGNGTRTGNTGTFPCLGSV